MTEANKQSDVYTSEWKSKETDQSIGKFIATYVIFPDANNGNKATTIDGFTGLRVGIPSSDISVELQYLINNKLIGGETIFFKSASGGITYTTNTSNTIFTKSVNLIFDGNVTINFTRQAPDNSDSTYNLFNFQGPSRATNISLTSNSLAGSNTIVVGAGNLHGASIGDLVLIHNNVDWNTSETDYLGIKYGQLGEIAQIDATTGTIYLNDCLLHDYTTATSSQIDIFNPITVVIDGLKMTTPDTTGFLHYQGIYFFDTKNSIVRNCEASNFGYWAFAHIDCYNTHYYENKIGNCKETALGNGYGIFVGNSSAYTLIRDNYFYDCRHAITQNSDHDPGQPRDTWIVNNFFANTNATRQAVDAHGVAESLYVIGNTFYPVDGSISYGHSAVVTGAKKTFIHDNLIYGGYVGISVRDGNIDFQTYNLEILEIVNNKFIGTTYPYYYSNNNNNRYDWINHFIFKDNVCTGICLSMVNLYCYGGIVDISGNLFDSTATSGGEECIYIRDASGGKIQNNIIINAFTYGILLYPDPPTVTNITAQVNSGQKVITVADASQFSSGEWVKLQDSTPQSENIQIDTVDSGTQVTMKTDLANTYTLAKSPAMATYTLTVTNLIISDNYLSNWNAGDVASEYGAITIFDATYCDVFGNKLIRPSPINTYGIVEDSQTTNPDYNNFFENNLKQVGANQIYQGTVGGHSKIWKNIGYLTDNLGTLITNGDGKTKTFKIAHNLASPPNFVSILPKTQYSVGEMYWTADDKNITVNFITAPPSGKNNVVLSWKAEV